MQLTMTASITGETWGETIQPVREYLLSESTQPLSVLRPKLEAAHTELLAALEDVSDEQAQLRPGEGQGEDAWGIAEVLRHVASAEALMAERVRLLGNGQALDSLRPSSPGSMYGVDSRDISELRTALDSSNAALRSALDEIDGHERLDTLAAHRRFGELNCRGWIVLHTLHLQDHARQIGKLKHMADS
jgi:uncharacterized damage-inducible protein DinB